MKLYYFLFFIPIIVNAQKGPSDSVFYSKGILKSVRYDVDYKFSYGVKRTFKKSENYLDANVPLIDTMFWRNYGKKKEWAHYLGPTRIFLNENSNVYINKSTKYGGKKDSVYNKIKGRYDFRFGDMGNLELTIGYNNDTLITEIFICKYDSIKSNKIQDHYVTTRFDKAKFSTGWQTYTCENHGGIQLYFRSNNLLSSITFYPKDTLSLATHYEFYKSFLCKQYGKIDGNVKIGKWVEYHPNGNISAFGEYKDDETTSSDRYSKDENQDTRQTLYYIKQGVWNFFNDNGLWVSEVFYEEGAIIKEKRFPEGKIFKVEN